MNKKIIKLRYDLKRMRTDTWNYVVIPTLMCNLDCTYCYQIKRNDIISNKTMNKVLAFIIANSKNTRNVFIVWYGGEPLICSDMIIRSSYLLNNTLSKNGIYFSGSIITNGTLLTQEIADDLYKNNIKKIQITFDGTKENHDKFRRYANNNPTYLSILEKLNFLPEDMELSIRIHLHGKTNTIGQLLNDISRIKSKCKKNISFSVTHPIKYSCKDIAYSSWNDINTLFSNIEQIIIEAIKLDLFVQLDTNKNFICSAVSRQSLLIEPTGMIKKCWSEVGDNDASIGTINNNIEITENNANLINWLSYDPVTNADDECYECNLFQKCYGGCPYMVKKCVKKPYRCHPCKGFVGNILPEIISKITNEKIGQYDYTNGIVSPILT